MANEHDNFVNFMLEKSKKKEELKPQKRYVDTKEVEEITSNIRDKLQKKQI